MSALAPTERPAQAFAALLGHVVRCGRCGCVGGPGAYVIHGVPYYSAAWRAADVARAHRCPTERRL